MKIAAYEVRRDEQKDFAFIAEKLGVDVLWIFPDGDIRYTPGLEARIVK